MAAQADIAQLEGPQEDVEVSLWLYMFVRLRVTSCVSSSCGLPVFYQEYVNRRIKAFAKAFAAEVSPHLLEDQVEKIVARLLEQQRGTALRAESASSPAQRFLVFTHDCQ
jgi:hypothetical protein